MKLQNCILLIVVGQVVVCSGKVITDEKKQDKRGIFDSEYGFGASEGVQYGGLDDYHKEKEHVKTTTITKKVPVLVPHLVPYTVEKKIHVPYTVKVQVPVPRPYTVHVPKPYPVSVPKPVPYTVNKPVPYPVKVPVRVPVLVPHKVSVPKPVPYTVYKPVPYTVKVPVYVEKYIPIVKKEHEQHEELELNQNADFGGHNIEQSEYHH